MNKHDVNLRAMEPEDLDLLYTIENDRQLWDVGATNVPYSRYVLHDYIATSSGDIYADRQVRFIVENGVGETIGLADLTNFDAKNCRAEIGMVFVRAYRGQGYGRPTLLQLIDYARRVLHIHQLYVIISCDNEAALQLFQHTGFDRASCLHDWLYDGEKYHDGVLMQRIF